MEQIWNLFREIASLVRNRTDALVKELTEFDCSGELLASGSGRQADIPIVSENDPGSVILRLVFDGVADGVRM